MLRLEFEKREGRGGGGGEGGQGSAMSIGSSNTRRLRILVGLFALTAVLLCGLITWEQTETNEEQMWPRQIAGDGMRRADAADRKLLMLSPSLYVAGVGDGLFSLFILYVLLIISCAVGCNIRNGCPLILISVIVVLVVTLVLVLSPRVCPSPSSPHHVLTSSPAGSSAGAPGAG